MLKRIELLDKYNIPGGRYTYFPFHSKWNNSFTHEHFIQYLNTSTENFVDVYVHIPFCHSLCTFCGCNVKVMKSDCDNKVYLNYLIKEWQKYPQKFRIKNLFIGGGTPNFLHQDELSFLLSSFPLEKDAQVTMEIDPRFLSKDDLMFYKKIGITRLSIGIQDFDENVLKNVNREQNENETIKLINTAYDIGFENINLDFIYGLNLQTLESFKNSIMKLKDVKTHSVSLYPFAKVPWQNNFQKAFGQIKDFTLHELNQMFVESSFILEELGFKNIGMGYFTNNQEKLKRNIMGFTPKKENILIGLGVSSISSSPIGHIQNEKVYDRYLGLLKEDHFTSFKSHLMTTEEFERQHFFENVICNNFISNQDIEKFKTDLFTNKLAEIEKDGLLIKSELGYFISNNNRYFHKTILQLFDPNFQLP